MLRSTWAVIAGYLTMTIVVVIADTAAGALFPEAFAGGRPPQAWLVTALVVGAVGAAFGGYVTATVARRAEFGHAIALCVVAVLMSIATMFMYAGQQPRWFQWALVLLGPPAILLGAWWRARSRARA